jgi:hypothetical protein
MADFKNNIDFTATYAYLARTWMTFFIYNTISESFYFIHL